MASVNDKPALSAEMVQALRRSGYLMESRINRVLRESDWLVNANNLIPDGQTGTPREADLVAERSYAIAEGQSHLFHNVVIVECINNDNPVVFLSRVPSDPARASNFFCMGGLPRTIRIPQGKSDGSDDAVSLHVVLGLDHKHRFFDLPVYDMYCTFAPKGKERHNENVSWRAEHPKDYYESFRKLCHVREYFQDIHDKRLCNDALLGSAEASIRIVHYHHVMVFKGPLVTVDEPDALIEGAVSGDACKSIPHLLYHRSQGDQHGVSGTLIDVITEDHLPKFVALLESESQHFCTILAGKKEQLLSQITGDARVLWRAHQLQGQRDGDSTGIGF